MAVTLSEHAACGMFRYKKQALPALYDCRSEQPFSAVADSDPAGTGWVQILDSVPGQAGSVGFVTLESASETCAPLVGVAASTGCANWRGGAQSGKTRA